MDSDVRKRKMQLVESDAGGQPPVKMSRAIYPEQPQRKPMTASDEMTPAVPVVASAHQQQQQPVDAKQAAYAANEPPQQQQQQLSADPFAGLANAAALNQLIQRTGYSITQENGQRKYGGPPPGWNGRPVPRGAEVFVGKIPRDVFEDELVPVFERAGTIYELRLMMDFDGKNRGYAFVMFGSKQEAKLAVRRLNNYEIRKGRMLGVCYSVDNCRLFVGGIPKTKKKDDIAAEMRKVTDGVCDVIVYPSASDKTKNRGFAFVEYESHRAAAMARRKLIPGRIQLWGHPIAVDWAEPEQEVDDDVMEQVKVLYVRNLMLDTSEDTLQAVFGRFGAVERVKKIRDYAFVHFNARDACLRAMRDVNGTRIDGAEVEVTLAKPVDKNDHNRMAKVGAKVLDGAGAAPAHLVAANPLQTAAVTPNGQMIVYPAGMYGSGEIAYYQPQHLNLTPPAAAPAGAIRNHDRARGAARNSYLGYSAGKATYGRYYAKNNQERTMVVDAAGLDMLQQQQLLNGQLASIGEQLMYKPNAGLSALAAASAAAGQQHQAYAAAPQLVAPRAPDLVLDEVCSRNMWGTPTYQLMTTPGPDQRQLFLYKVSVPAFASLYPHQPYFQPDKLCVTVDEARTYAAEYVLAQVGLQADGSSSQQQQQQQATVIPMTTLLQPQHQQVAYQLAPQPALQLSASPTGAPPTFVPVTTPSPTAAFPMSFVDPAHMMSHTMQPITVMYQ